MNLDKVVPKVLLNRPLADISALIELLSPVAERVTLKSRFDRLIPRGNIYFMTSGMISFRRHKDHMIAATLYDRAVIGLTEFIEPLNGFYLQSDDPKNLELYGVTNDAFTKIVNENPICWKHIAIIIGHVNNLFTMRDMHLNTQLAWDSLRGKLFELMVLPDNIRSKHTIIDYVCERTSLSRGTVMQMLRELKRGEYINIKNGRLVSINKIPQYY